MKILAVRGENISSLQSFFEVDFSKEPLASAGVFAISGPTGAGKSTLLDAICLALYQTTPRLTVAPSKDVVVPDAENKEISVSDPRNLLRRGAAFGWCEVDYVGVDRNQYRARWSVKRAYNSPKGKLQNPQVQLSVLPDKTLLAESVKDVGQHILRTVGLTYSEFTRSVLLAQNEFTSFLRATDNERAVILEKLTGVDVFTKIGVYVFRKTASLEDEKKSLNRTLEQIRILSEGDRTSAVEQLNTLTARNAVQTEMKNALTNFQILDRQLSDAKKKADVLEKELSLHTAQQIEFSRTALLSQQEYETSVAQKNAAQPTLLRARTLEAQFENLNRQANELRDTLVKQTRICAESQEKLNSLILKKSSACEEIERLSEWSEKNPRLKRLAEEWPAYDELMSRSESLATHQHQATVVREKAEISCKQFQQQLEKIQSRLNEASADRAQRLEKIKVLKSAAAQQDLSILLQEVSALDENRRNTEKLIESKKSLNQVQVSLKETREAHEHNRNLLESLSIQLTDVSKRIDKKKEEQVVALKYKERIERSVSENAHSMRAALQPGAACPVCGSVDHPYAHGQHQPLSELAREAQLEFDAACRAVELLQSESSRMGTEAAKLQVNLGHQRQQLIEFESQEKEYSSTVSQLCAITGVPLNESHSALDIRLSDLNRSLNSAKESLKSAERTQSELRQIVQHHEQMERSWEKDSQEHAHIAQELRLQQEKLGYTHSEIERIANELRQLFLRLEVVGTHAEWQSQFLGQPAEYREKSRKDVALWFSKQKEIEALSNLSAELKNQIEVSESGLSDKKQIISESENQLTRLNGQLESVTSELSSILNGVSASEFESRLNSIVAAKEKERDILQRREQEQQILVARLETQRTSLDARQKELSVENDKLTLRLNELVGVLEVSWSQAPLPMWLAQLEPQLERDLALELKLRGTLEADEQAKQQSASLLKTVDSLEHDLVRWRDLSELVGCSTGAKFRKEAHRLTLEVLLTHANYHLESFARRYQLRIPAEGQGLLLEDCDAGGELRSVYSLSGGESFLVSLALAMGLASLSAEQIPVESLFIDEGFGSLDSESLKVALDALDALQAHGRKVGVISHVPEMAERIGVHIEVKPEGLGRSRVLPPQANTYL